MDLYGNQVSFSGATLQAKPVRALKVTAVEIGPVGCLACTSGDSPIWDFEQHILFNR